MLQHLISLLQIEDVAGAAARRVAGVASAQDIVKYVAHVDTHTHTVAIHLVPPLPLVQTSFGRCVHSTEAACGGKYGCRCGTCGSILC